MMGQELFQNPRCQYAAYGLTALDKETPELGDPSAFENDTASEAQVSLLESVLEQHADAAVTFDVESELWIVGAEDDVERMFADRDAFLDALEAGEDPGV